MRCPVLLALLTILPMPVWPQELPNLLTNPGFEAVDEAGWAQGWTVWPAKLPEAGAVSVDGAVAHGGQRSLRLRHASLGSYTRAQQVLAVEPHQRYAFTVWVKAENVVGGGGSMGARLYVEGLGGRDRATEAVFGTADWQQLLVGPHDSGNGGRITVMCYLHLASGTVWFDDLQAFKVTPEWEQQMEQKRLQAGLEAQVRLAEDTARRAADQTAMAELAALRAKAGGVKLAAPTDFRHGPPYNEYDAEVYATMARLNARRLGQRGGVVAWAADPFAPVPALGLVPERRQLAISLTAAVGDREQAALNLCNLGNQPVRARVSCDVPGATSPKVTLREAVHVETQGGRLIADPLPRLRDGRMDLPPGVFRQLWCDFSTTDCQAGTYRSRVQVSIPGQPPLTCPITVRVLRTQLPAMAPIATWNYFDRAVASHGPIQWLLLWPGFEWPKNVALRQEGLEPGTPLWEERFTTWFRAVIAGLKERGFGYDRVAWYLRDEPTTAASARVVALTGAAVHKADPRALVVENPYHAATQPVLDAMAPVVDIWCPMLSWPKGELLQWFQERSRKSGLLWTYQVLSKDADAFAAYRLSFWDCWRKGMSGQGFWDYADTGGTTDNWTPYPEGRTFYSVVYNGDPEELIPSRRWEAWREGTEDYTLLWLLKQSRPQSPLLADGVEKLMAAPSPEALAGLRSRVLEQLGR